MYRLYKSRSHVSRNHVQRCPMWLTGLNPVASWSSSISDAKLFEHEIILLNFILRELEAYPYNQSGSKASDLHIIKYKKSKEIILELLDI